MARLPHPVAIIAISRLRRGAAFLRAGIVAAVILIIGLSTALMALGSSAGDSFAAGMAAMAIALSLIAAFDPDLPLLGILRNQPISLPRLGLWFIGAPLLCGGIAVAFIAAPWVAGAVYRVALTSGAVLVACALIALLLLHGLAKSPRLARMAATIDTVLTLMISANALIVAPVWIAIRTIMLILNGRRSRWTV